MRASELSTAMTISMATALCQRVISSPFVYEDIKLCKQSGNAVMRNTDLQ